MVPHTLTNKFHPLDISVNKTIKVFVQNCQESLSNQVAAQLKRVANPANIKMSSKLCELKPLDASWIVDLYDNMCN